MTRFKTICGFFWRIPSIKGTTVESASQISPSHHTTSRGPTKLHCDPPIDFWIQAVVSRHSQLSENMTQNLLKIPNIWDCWWTDDIRDCSTADLKGWTSVGASRHTHTPSINALPWFLSKDIVAVSRQLSLQLERHQPWLLSWAFQNENWAIPGHWNGGFLGAKMMSQKRCEQQKLWSLLAN